MKPKRKINIVFTESEDGCFVDIDSVRVVNYRRPSGLGRAIKAWLSKPILATRDRKLANEAARGLRAAARALRVKR